MRRAASHLRPFGRLLTDRAALFSYHPRSHMDVEALLRYWTLQSPEGYIVTCDLVRSAKGLEVRCAWSDGAQARVARAASIEAITDALNLAEAWKAFYVRNGWVAKSKREPRRAR